jgi:hypothetical protein
LFNGILCPRIGKGSKAMSGCVLEHCILTKATKIYTYEDSKKLANRPTVHGQTSLTWVLHLLQSEVVGRKLRILRL